jgi:signal transduction histidine kinase
VIDAASRAETLAASPARVARRLEALLAGPRRWWPELVLGGFAATNLALMWVWDGWEAVPFHFIFTAVMLMYAARLWRVPFVLVVAGLTALGCGGMTTISIVRGSEHPAELVEVPLMLMMIGAMTWHVQTRRRATAVVARVAAEREAMLQRERRFFANVTHDLMTPLTIARGHVEVLRRAQRGASPATEETCAVVLDELGRMEGLVEDLLLIGQLDTPDRIDKVQLDAQAFLEKAAALVRSRASSWSIDLDAHGEISIDPTGVERAIANLVDNAIAHSRCDDAVCLRARARDGALVVEVADEGAGIPPEALEHMFERFWRGPRSRARRRAGSGLGLSIVQAVADAHGGRVRVASEPGRGTRIALELPGFVPSTGRATRERHRVEPLPPHPGGRRAGDPPVV